MTDGLTDKDRAGIRAALEACPKVRRAVLFGSRALGTFRGASDVDLALEGDDLRLTDLVAIKAMVAKGSIPVEVDLVIRAKIDNPDVENHIQDFGREWYRKGWHEMTLGDFVTIQRGHDLTEPERRPGRVPVMGSAGQNGFHDTALAKGPGIVIGRSGASFGQVHFSKEDFWPHNTGLYVTDFKGNDPLFAFYFLKALDFDRFNSGSAQPSLNRNFIYPIPIRVPKPTEQKAIAAVLGALDDKIELNRRMNATLEAMARALFQSWFVDFDPVRAKPDGRPPAALDPATAGLFPATFQDSPLGPIPHGWTAQRLPDAIEVNPRRSLKGGVVAPYLDMKNLPTQGHSAKEVIDREFSSGTKFQNGDTLLARITPCLENGKTGYVDFLEDGQVGWGSTEYIVLAPKLPLPPQFGYLLARSDALRSHAIQNMTGTSGRQRVPSECFNTFFLAVPTPNIACRFDELTAPLMAKIKANSTESRTLATLRDTLLPKLLSGELAVNELNATAP